MEELILIQIKLEGHDAIHVEVGQYLTIKEVIKRVCKYHRVRSKNCVCYLVVNNTRYPLDHNFTLGQQNIVNNSELLILPKHTKRSPTYTLIQKNKRYYFDATRVVSLQIEGSGKSYPLEWQPAILGRSGQDDHLLAVDLTLEHGAGRISRQHACITRQNGQYYVEHIAEKDDEATNKTEVNGKRLQPWVRYPIQPGDCIRLNTVSLIFQIRE